MQRATKGLLACVTFAAALTCQAQGEQASNATESSYPRFIRDTTDDLKLQIVTDRQTGCRYLMADASGMTPLLKADGAPDCRAAQKRK